MRSGDPEIHGDLAGRIIEDGPGVMVVGPVIDIVIVLADVVDLVFRLHGAVLGQTDIDPGGGAVIVRKIDPRIGQGLIGAVDADANQ